MTTDKAIEEELDTGGRGLVGMELSYTADSNEESAGRRQLPFPVGGLRKRPEILSLSAMINDDPASSWSLS
jgi:hypothetical protein